MHRTPLQNISAIRTSITAIIRLPNIQVWFFPQSSSHLVHLYPNPTLAIINIRDEEKGKKRGRPLCKLAFRLFIQ